MFGYQFQIITTCSLFLLSLLTGEADAQGQDSKRQFAYQIPVVAEKLLSTQAIGLPENLNKNGFEFLYKDPNKVRAIYPLKDLGEFKDEFAVLKLLSANIPYNYDPQQVKTYVVFATEQVTPGGLLLKLHTEPVAGAIDMKSKGLIYLPTNYPSTKEALAAGNLVDKLKRHFDAEKYEEIKSWKK